MRGIDEWIKGCIEEDAARGVRDRVSDVELYPMLREDVRGIVRQAAAELGVKL